MKNKEEGRQIRKQTDQVTRKREGEQERAE